MDITDIIKRPVWERPYTGKDVSKYSTMAEVIHYAGLDYQIEKVPLFLPNGKQFDGKFALVQLGLNEPLGLVGTTYQVHQNRDLFLMLEGLSDEGEYVKAGLTENNIAFVLFKLDRKFSVGGQDFDLYIMSYTRNSVEISFRIELIPVFPPTGAIVKIDGVGQRWMNIRSERYPLIIEKQVDEVRLFIDQYMNDLDSYADFLISQDVEGYEESIIHDIIPLHKYMANVRIIENEVGRAWCWNLYVDLCNTPPQENHYGTAWGMTLVLMSWETCREPSRKVKRWQEKALERVLFDNRDYRKMEEVINGYVKRKDQT